MLGAVADGVDVRGVFFWTLRDNIEWHEGFGEMHFGLYGPAPPAGSTSSTSASAAAAAAAADEGSSAKDRASAASSSGAGSARGDGEAVHQEVAQAGDSAAAGMTVAASSEGQQGASCREASSSGGAGPGGSSAPVLREGSKALLRLHQQWPCGLDELRSFAAQQRAAAESGLLRGPTAGGLRAGAWGQ